MGASEGAGRSWPPAATRVVLLRCRYDFPKDTKKTLEDSVQKTTDGFVKKVDDMVKAKTDDIMKV